MKTKSINHYRKIRIAVLSALLAFAAVMLIYSVALILQSGKRDNADQEMILSADGQDSSCTVSPMIIPILDISFSTYFCAGSGNIWDPNTVFIPKDGYTNKSFTFYAMASLPYAVTEVLWTDVNGSAFTHSASSDNITLSNNIANGWYSFKARSGGNYSSVAKIGLDTAKPQIQARINGSSVANGTVTTSSSAVISLFGSDSFSGVESYWYTMNGWGGTYYQCYSSSTYSSDGVYTFYCVDYAGNVSDTITVTKDSTAPTVNAYNNSAKLSDNAIVNASSVRFEASDPVTGVDGIYIRLPGAANYTYYTGTSATLSTEGLYYFYARDKAGNSSSAQTVTIDRTAPAAQLYSGTMAVSNNYYSAASYVYFSASDANGCTCYIKKDSGSYSVYTSGTSVAAEGVYSFYAVDPAGNTTSIYTITLDRTAPVGTLYAGTTVVSNGKITNASYVTYTATDNYALSALYVYKPGASDYVTFASGTQFTADGWYYFYATDKSGNSASTVSILLDRTKPAAIISAGGTTVSSGGYTNAASVTFSASDAGSGVSAMYIRLPDSSSYISYVTGTPFGAEGIYYFYATDVAGNTSDTVSVTLDRAAPTGTLTVNGAAVSSGSFTNKAFYYTASDSLSGVSKYEIKRPGSSWETYTSGTSIAATSAQGLYSFRAADKAGNISIESQINLVTAAPTVTINAGTTAVSSGTFVNSSYVGFTVTASYGAAASLYVKMPGSSSFTLYASGTQFSKEGKYEVYTTDNAGNTGDTVSVTLDVTKPAGTLTANGLTFSSGSFTNQAFYYTASDSLSGVSKYEIKRPGGSWETYTSGTSIAATSAQGLYSFRATDKAGNISEESQINLVTSAPTITINAGTTIVASGTFTNSSYVAFTVTAVYGATASLYVKTPDSSSFTLYSSGTQFSKEGKYEVYANDVAGNTSDTASVTLDRAAPTGTLTVNGVAVSSGSFTNKAFYYAATDTMSGLDNCEIKKPGSSSWETYTPGTSIAATSAQGLYSFRATDKAGNMSEESQINLVTTAPTITIYAGTAVVSSGTYTNKNYIAFTVTASYGATASLYVKMPDSSSFTLYATGAQLSTEGKYEAYAADNAGNTGNTVSVTLDVTKPSGILTANGLTVASGSFTNKAFYYAATDSMSGLDKCEIKKPGSGNWETHTSGTSIAAASAQGLYSFRAIDKAGNVSEESQINLVTAAPTVTIYAGTTPVLSGTFTNAGYVAFTATGATGSTASLYIEMPDTSSFTSYASGAQLTKEGLYSFYATDNAGNKSATVSITLDVTKPAGEITAGGVTVASGSFANMAFAYTAADGVSGVDKYEIKRPGGVWEAYASGTLIAATSSQGLYSFRAIDKAGNISEESQINLVTAVPTVTIYAGTTGMPSGNYTNKSYVAFTVTASYGATASLYVKMPDSNSFTLYASGTQLSKEGKYEAYAADNAGNTSAAVTITLDVSNPVGTIAMGGMTVQSGGYVNSAFKYSATDSVSGIARLEILRPNGNWQTYDGAEIASASGNGWYSFRATDNSGNMSAESKVYLLTLAPGVQLYADEHPVSNGTYTNLTRVSMSVSCDGNPAGSTAVTCYVKLPDSGGFTVCTPYFSYTAAGRYEFYAEDQAGNGSGIFVIVVDRATKPVSINGTNNGTASGDVMLTWNGSDTEMAAPIVSVTVNGISCYQGTIIKTIDGGVYLVKSTDAAGNVWSTAFTAARTDVISATLNKQYWESKDSAGKTYAFASYESALTFAKEREAAVVKTGTWSGAVWDAGIPMDSLDSTNAANGKYYIYKKSGSPGEEVAYFTIERLNEVLTEYATAGIKSYYYWEKEASTVFGGENLYSYSYAKIILTHSVILAGNACYLIDGEVFTGNVYEAEGWHTLTVFDEWGNTYDYTLIVIRRAPDILYALERGAGNIVSFDRSYYFNAAASVTIADGYDEFAMFNIYAENGKLLACLSLGETYVFDKSGKYTVQAVNHFGQSKVFTLLVSLDAPKAQILENTKDKRLEIRITESIDAHSHIQTLEICKSADGGKTWMLVDKDDYGNVISLNRSVYMFRTTGLYKVVLTDEFRTGIDAVTAQLYHIQDKPEGTLTGVENGGYTNGTVIFKWTDEAVVTLEKDGVGIAYASGQKLTGDGSYILTFENFDGYKAVYSFIIDNVAPAVSLDGVKNGGIVNTDVSVSWEEKNVVAELYKDGKFAGGFESGIILAESGEYHIVVTDAAGNATEVRFVIDKIVDFTINVNDKGLSNSVTVHAYEELKAVLEKDGEIVSYTFGDSITAVGHYVLTLTDEIGNIEEISFIIIKPLVQSFEYNFDDMPGFEKVTVNGEDKRLNYGTLELKTDGVYEIGVFVNGVSYNFIVTIDATAPTLVLSGVENGGTTKGEAVLKDVSEQAEVKVYLNGAGIEYELGDKLAQAGKYRVVLSDLCGNTTEYTFEILRSTSAGVIALVIIAIIAVIGGGVFMFLKKRKKI